MNPKAQAVRLRALNGSFGPEAARFAKRLIEQSEAGEKDVCVAKPKDHVPDIRKMLAPKPLPTEGQDVLYADFEELGRQAREEEERQRLT